MSIQRYDNKHVPYLVAQDDGAYVLYSDHIAALRACEQRVRDEERAGAPVAMIELAGYSRGYASGVQEGLRMAVNLIDPEPMSCDCRMPLCKDIGAHEYGCSCGGVTTLPREAPNRYASHGYGCAWAEWARRELNRRQQSPQT